MGRSFLKGEKIAIKSYFSTCGLFFAIVLESNEIQFFNITTGTKIYIHNNIKDVAYISIQAYLKGFLI